MRELLTAANLSASQIGTPSRRSAEIERFRNLYDLTQKSIKKDIELSRGDSAFAVIATPWFRVKCYYALYYLESILVHLIDGSSSGFGKQATEQYEKP